MSHFDPFDSNNRDKRTRRTKAQVQADQKAWDDAIDSAFRCSLDGADWPDYVQSDLLLDDAAPHHDNYYALRHNMKSSMERIGYAYMWNERTKDGRWKAMGKNVGVYKRKSCPDIGYDKLKPIMEW